MKKFILICLLNIITSNFLFSKTYQIEFETLIERGSLIYPDLKRKQFELSNVILQKEEVDYRRLPSISGGLGFSYVPYIYRDGGTIKIDSSFPADWSIVLAPSLSVTLPIYTFGKIPNGEKAALYQVELKKAELEETDSNVRYQMKQVFWGYLLAKIMIDKILKDVLKQYDKFVSEKETDFSQGKTTRASLESTKIAYYDYQRHESDAYLSLNQTYYLIRAIYGASKEDTVETPYKRLLPVELSIKPFEDYLELSKNFNYSFKKAHFGYLARKYYYEYQKATYWPDIGLLFSTSYVYRKQDKMFEENGSYIPKTTLLPEIGWTISLGFGMNFDFTFWRKNNAQEQYLNSFKFDVELMKNAYDLQEIEVQKAYDNMVESKKKLDLADEQYKAAKRWLFMSINAYKSGTGSIDEAQGAYGSIYWRKRDYYTMIYNYNMAVANFERLLGVEIVDYQKFFKKQLEFEKSLNDETDDE